MRWFAVLLVLWAGEAAGTRYAFFRQLRERGGRRVFGGVTTHNTWLGACALLDRTLSARCSCSILAPRWALTAAHCADNGVVFVQYSKGTNGEEIVSVRLLYRHPEFSVIQKDLGAGMDVVTLHHDIGMVRTRTDMKVPSDSLFPIPMRAGPEDPVERMSAYAIEELLGKEIDVLGYGMTEQKPAGERLREVRLRLVSCDRLDWWNCACAMGEHRGVCAGDSGGPVLYNGTQIGVTSMGPVECGSDNSAPKGTEEMSVFTQIRPYAALIDDTMREVDSALRMRVIPSAAARSEIHVVICSVSLLLCRGF